MSPGRWWQAPDSSREERDEGVPLGPGVRPPIMPNPQPGVGTSADAARMSACATSSPPNVCEKSGLFPQLHDSRAGAAFLLRRGVELRDVRVVAEEFGDGLLEYTHPVAVHDADAAGGSHHGPVQELVHGVAGLFGMLADDVDLLVSRRQFGSGSISNTLRQAAGRSAGFGQHFDHVVLGNLHLEEAGLHFDAAVSQLAAHAGRFADVAPPHARPLFQAQRRDAVLAGIVTSGQYGGLEIPSKLAFGLGDAALGLLFGFAPVQALGDLADGLRSLLFEARQRQVGAAFQLLELGALAFLPFPRQLFFALFELRALLAQALLRDPCLFDAAVQLGQEARHVAFAVAHGQAGAAHDVFGGTQPRGALHARRV